MSGSSSPDGKIDAARTALVECLKAVETAFGELEAEGAVLSVSIVDTPRFRQRLEHKILGVALALQRLEGAARRLVKRLGHDTRAFEGTLRSCTAVRVTGRLADSWKHGLGGQSGNATFLNGLLTVRRADGYPDPFGAERVHVLGMVVADASAGAIPSSTLLPAAVHEWASLLEGIVPEAGAWAERLFPKPDAPIVLVPDGEQLSGPPIVPVGATLLFPVPAGLQATMIAEAKRRRDRA